MKKLLSLLAILILGSTAVFSQTCPTAPGTGVYVMFDSTYQVGTVSAGITNIRMCFANTTTSKITGVQFRIWYDKNAFAGAAPIVTSLNTSFAQHLQYVNNTTEGNVTVTISYTGSSSTFNIPDGQLFNIKLTHSSNFWSYTTISDMKITGVTAFTAKAADIDGLDATLSLHNYGGVITPQLFNYHGTFTNVTGTPAKNLTLALQRKAPTGSWADFATVATDLNGDFAFNDQPIDTTYYDVRLRVQGDTLAYGNIVTTADAQRINDIILGTVTPTGFDFHSSDVNGSNTISIADVYSVFGRIAGRFSVWPNSVKDVMFFSASEYATINGSSTNYASSIPGVTNLTFDILPGQPDSVTFYVLGKGDANGTGYNMARMIPVDIINPNNALNYIIDKTIQFDNPVPIIELNLPRFENVQPGNLIDVPVKYLSPNDDKVGSLQFGVWYDSSLVQFKGIENTGAVSKWMTYTNPESNIVDWGGYDPFGGANLVKNGDVAFTLKFVALQPRSNWTTSPLWVTRKAAGGPGAQDYGISPTEGKIELKMIGGNGTMDVAGNTLFLYPNPTEGIVTFSFNLVTPSRANLGVYDINGRKCVDVVTGNFPDGKYSYTVDLGNLESGLYAVVLTTDSSRKIISSRVIKQ